MTTWTEAEFAAGMARVGSLHLRLAGESVSIASPVGSISVKDTDVCGIGKGLTAWVNVAAQVVVIAAQLAEVLYLVVLRAERVTAEHLFRDQEPDLRFLTVHPIAGGSLLALYERGLLRLDADGTVRWHRLHDDLSARVAELSTGEVVLETQWPIERIGQRHRYRLDDGEELIDA